MMMKQQIIRQIMYFTMSKAENKALFQSDKCKKTMIIASNKMQRLP